MSTPLPPLLDGLIGLTRSVIDNSSQRSWTEIEDLEKEDQQKPPAERVRQSAAGSAQSSSQRQEAATTERSPPWPGTSAVETPRPLSNDHKTMMGEAVKPSLGGQRPVDPRPVDQPASVTAPVRTSAPIPGGSSAPVQTVSHQTERGLVLPVGDIFGRHVVEKAAAAGSNDTAARQTVGEALSSAIPMQTPTIRAPVTVQETQAAIPVERFSAVAVDHATSPQQTMMSPPHEAPAALGSTGPVAAGVEHSLLTSGPVAASQKLHSAIRAMSPEQVSIFLDSASALVASVFEKASEGGQVSEHGPRTDHQSKEVRTALAIAHIAAAIDKDPRSPSSMRLKQDIAALVLSPAAPNDNAVFTGLSQAIGVGAGAKLALIVAYELAHQRDGRSRSRSLLALMLAGFVRLGERVDEAYAEVMRHAGPLCMEWMKWRTDEDGEAIAALIGYLQSEPLLLEELEPRLEKLEQTGLEAFRAIRDLSGYSFSPELSRVHDGLLASDTVFAAIASSRTALKDIRHLAVANVGGEDAVTIDAVRLVLTKIGFDAPRAAFLADVSELGRGTMLGSTWTALASFPEMEAKGRAFQRLLAFLNGQYVVIAEPETVSFDSHDMQDE